MKNARVGTSLSAIVVTAAVSLSGCSLLGQGAPAPQPVRDPETGQVTEELDNADVFAIRVGDCLNTADLESSSELTGIPVVPCDEPHDDEVFYAYQVADGEFPGEDAITAQAASTCIPEFEAFIGIPYADSVYDFWPMYPSAASWETGDRVVLCIAWDPSGEKVSGTLKGVAR